MDPAKNVIEIVSTFLTTLYVQPYQDGPLTTVWFVFFMLNLIILQIGQFCYVYLNINDLNKVASASSTISTTFQGISKIFTLHMHKQEFKVLLNNIRNNFWTIDMLKDKKIKTRVAKLIKIVNTTLICYLLTIYFISSLLFTHPLFLMSGDLAVRTWLPFDFTKSPIYELLYTYQCIVNFYMVVWTVGVFDYFFIALMLNLIVQFYILKQVIVEIGTESSELIENAQMKKVKDMTLLIKFIKQHQLLIGFGNSLANVSSSMLLFQYGASFLLMTVGCFIMGSLSGITAFTFIAMVLAHVAQLFVFCGAGTELYSQSLSLSDAAFNSGWYRYNCPELRQALSILIQQSHRGRRISAMGMADLNYMSFVAVLRLSFSVCTLLMSVTEK